MILAAIVLKLEKDFIGSGKAARPHLLVAEIVMS